jgi:uncharacterized protein YndB with AHSA1/START domain
MDDRLATRTVETTQELGVPPERAIQAFLRDEDLRGWWKVSRSLVDPRPGGVWTIVWDAYGDPPTNHMWAGTIRELDETRLLIAPMVQNEPDRPLFGPLQLEIFAEPASDGCRLTVLHHGYQHGEHWDWLHEAVVNGWVAVLADMKDWLESES